MVFESIKDTETDKDGNVQIWIDVLPTVKERAAFLAEGWKKNSDVWKQTTFEDMQFDMYAEYVKSSDTIEFMDIQAFTNKGDTDDIILKSANDFIEYQSDLVGIETQVRNKLKTMGLLKEKEPENMCVRFTWRSEIVLEGKDLREIKAKWENMDLFSSEARAENAEFLEMVSVEDAETYDDLESEWDNLY